MNARLRQAPPSPMAGQALIMLARNYSAGENTQSHSARKDMVMNRRVGREIKRVLIERQRADSTSVVGSEWDNRWLKGDLQVWGRLAIADSAGRSNLTARLKNAKRRSSHRQEAAAPSCAHRA
jgi:hypothetical protein